MKKTDVLSHYKTVKAAAAAAGVSTQAVYDWPERIPEKSAARLSHASDGLLTYSPSNYALSL